MDFIEACVCLYTVQYPMQDRGNTVICNPCAYVGHAARSNAMHKTVSNLIFQANAWRGDLWSCTWLMLISLESVALFRSIQQN